MIIYGQQKDGAIIEIEWEDGGYVDAIKGFVTLFAAKVDWEDGIRHASVLYGPKQFETATSRYAHDIGTLKRVLHVDKVELEMPSPPTPPTLEERVATLELRINQISQNLAAK